MIETAQRLPYTNSCVQNILLLRAEIPPRKTQLEQKGIELDDLMSQFPDLNQDRENARQRSIARLRNEIRTLEDQIGRLEAMLDSMEKECAESEAQRPGDEDRAGLEQSLRQTIDDPRYWRDGDPALGQFVSDGFKRLYPDD